MVKNRLTEKNHLHLLTDKSQVLAVDQAATRPMEIRHLAIPPAAHRQTALLVEEATQRLLQPISPALILLTTKL